MRSTGLLVVGLPALCLLVWFPGHLEQFEAPKAHLLRAFGVVALLGVAGRGPWTWRPLDIAVLAMLAVEILSAALALDPRLAVLGEMRHKEGVATTLGLVGVYFGFRHGGASLQRRALLFALLASVPLCIYALVQAAGWDPLPWGGSSPVGSMRALRPFSTQGHPNHLGAVTCGLLGATTVLWLRNSGQRWWLTAVGLLLLTTTMLAFSRAGWVGALAALAVAAALQALARARGRTPNAGVTSCMLLGVLAVATPGPETSVVVRQEAAAVAQEIRYTWLDVLLDRGQESARPAEGSARSRWEIWRAAVAMGRAHPWLGVGPDHFALHFPAHQTPEYWRHEWAAIPVHAHSLPLHVLATRGGAGLVALLAALLLAVVQVARTPRRRETESGSPTDLVDAAAALGSGVFAASLFGSPSVAGMVLLAWALATIAAGTTRSGAPATPIRPSRPVHPRRPTAVLLRGAVIPGLQAGVLVLLLVFAGREVLAGRDGAQALAWSGIDPLRALALAERAYARMPIDEYLHQVRTHTALMAAVRTGDPTVLTAAREAAREWLQRNAHRSQAHLRNGSVESVAFSHGEEAAAARALEHFQRAIDLAPHDALAMAEYARGLQDVQRWAEARSWLDRALALYPERELLWRESARLRLWIGDLKGAAADLRRAGA